MKKLKLFSYIIVICTLLFSSCKNFGNGFICDEGEIVYEIEYLEDEESNPLISLLPSQLKMVFKDDNIAMNVEGWMGIFRSAFLRVDHDKKIYVLLKVLNKKYYYQNTDAKSFMGITYYEDVSVILDDSIKIICDIECKHAVVSVPSKELIFDAFYTDKIDIKEANKGTPFSEIPGVLMEFQVDLNNIPMHLTAIEVNPAKVEKKLFDIPEGYQHVEKEVVDSLIGGLLK